VLFFFVSYYIFDGTSVASTGYNASTKGFFAWKESFAEYGHNSDGDWVMTSSSSTLKFSALFTEIALCVTLATVIAVVSRFLLPTDRLFD